VSPRLKNFFQYAVILGVTVLLVVFSLRGLKVEEGQNKWDYLQQTWATADLGWLVAMAVFSMVSHVIRAERWRMVLQPTGHQASLSSSFYSVMVGYLVNLVIPRGGEISRAYNLYKLENILVEVSFGTVVLERIVDLICLAALIFISFAFESQRLLAFMETLPIGSGAASKLNVLLVLFFVGVVCAFVFYWFIKKNKKLNDRIRKLWTGFKGGVLSIFKLKNKGLFIFYSVSIWGLYFLSSYAVLKAFPATNSLDFTAVLSVFAIGAIAMAAPLPGGTGSYHVLVPQGLFFLYQIPLSDAVAFTFIFHGWQTLILILAGALSLFITSYLVKRNAAKVKPI
jgi:glycosyltransferase 2 family protein